MLSALIITQNEEKNIKECLESICSIVDEIILLDSYSTDNTIKIAKQYKKVIVYLRKFRDDFSDQRNFALTKCRGDWIFSIDADERVSKELKKVIPFLIQNKNLNGYLIPRRQYINKKEWLKHGLFYPDYQLRLFRKKGVKYINKVHEYPNIDEKRVKKITQYLIHNHSRTKYDRFSSIIRLRKFIIIRSKELVVHNHPIIYYFFNGIYLFFKYFINSFIRGKGYLDGWNGFRAAVIFSSFALLSFFVAGFEKIKIFLKNKYITNFS